MNSFYNIEVNPNDKIIETLKKIQIAQLTYPTSNPNIPVLSSQAFMKEFRNSENNQIITENQTFKDVKDINIFYDAPEYIETLSTYGRKKPKLNIAYAGDKTISGWMHPSEAVIIKIYKTASTSSDSLTYFVGNIQDPNTGEFSYTFNDPLVAGWTLTAYAMPDFIAGNYVPAVDDKVHILPRNYSGTPAYGYDYQRDKISADYDKKVTKLDKLIQCDNNIVAFNYDNDCDLIFFDENKRIVSEKYFYKNIHYSHLTKYFKREPNFKYLRILDLQEDNYRWSDLIDIDTYLKL